MTEIDWTLFDQPEPDPYCPPSWPSLQTRPIPGLPRARKSDPVESHEAAASVTNLTEKQAAVLGCLRGSGRALTDHDIAARYERFRESGRWPQQSESGLRTRRSELVAQGLIEKAGRGKLPTGRSAAMWRVV